MSVALRVQRLVADLRLPAPAADVDRDRRSGLGEIGPNVSHPDPDSQRWREAAAGDGADPLVAGEDLAVNDEAGTNPELINTDPYGKGWMVKVRLSDLAEVDTLLDAAAYRDLIAD